MLLLYFQDDLRKKGDNDWKSIMEQHDSVLALLLPTAHCPELAGQQDQHCASTLLKESQCSWDMLERAELHEEGGFMFECT